MSTSVGFCPIRVVCWNTLSAGLRDSRSSLLKVKHTASQKQALAAIRETVNLVDETFEATAAQYRQLVACGVSRDDMLSGMSEQLPALVDQLTPQGRLPTEEEAARWL